MALTQVCALRHLQRPDGLLPGGVGPAAGPRRLLASLSSEGDKPIQKGPVGTGEGDSLTETGRGPRQRKSKEAAGVSGLTHSSDECEHLGSRECSGPLDSALTSGGCCCRHKGESSAKRHAVGYCLGCGKSSLLAPASLRKRLG